MKKETVMVALDTSSSNTGVAVFINGILKEYHNIDMTSEEAGEVRLNAMCCSIINELKVAKPDICVCEMTVVERSAHVQRLLSEIVGVTRGFCLTKNIWFDRLRPSEWRKLIISNFDSLPPLPTKRNELKKWSKETVRELFGINVDDNVSDAILIGIAYICIFGDVELFKKENKICLQSTGK